MFDLMPSSALLRRNWNKRMPESERDGKRTAAEISLRDYVIATLETHRQHNDLRFDMIDQRLEYAIDNLANRMKALETASSLALHSNEQALLKAEATTEKRFDSVNEFRQMLNDMNANSMPRSEANLMFKSMQEALHANTDRLNLTQGADQGVKSSWLFVVGLIASVAGAASIFILMTGSS